MFGPDERIELQNQYDTLTRRIAAIDRDLGHETDGERRLALQERRAELANERSTVANRMQEMDTQPARKTDGAIIVAGYDPMQDGRVSNVEATLRTMDQKLDRMTDTIHDLDTRQRLLEEKVVTLASTVQRLDATVQAIRGVSPDYSRAWLLAGGVSIVIVLILLIFITWRLV